MSRRRPVSEEVPPDSRHEPIDVEQDGAAIAVAEPPKNAAPAPAVPAAMNPMELLQFVMRREALPAEIREVMQLVKEWRAEMAAEHFGTQFALFQAELPQIEKSREVHRAPDKGGALLYKFASMEDVDRVVKPIKGKYGLSTSGSIKTTDKGIVAEWELQIGSHVKTRTFELPLISSAGLVQNANATQNLGAWLTYLSRYTYCLALGVVVRGEDTDANLIREATLIDEETVEEVEGWFRNGALRTDGSVWKPIPEKVLAFLQHDIPPDKRSVATLTTGQFKTLVSTFEIKREGKKRTANGGAD